MAESCLEDKQGYIKYALINSNPNETIRRVNYAKDKMINWFNAFKQNLPAAERFLKPLIENPDENYSVACWACAHALALRILTIEAINALNELLEHGDTNELEILWNCISAKKLLQQHYSEEGVNFSSYKIMCYSYKMFFFSLYSSFGKLSKTTAILSP